MNELLGMTDSTGTDIRYNDVVPVTHPEPLTPDEGVVVSRVIALATVFDPELKLCMQRARRDNVEKPSV